MRKAFKGKPAIRRSRAEADIQEIVSYYQAQDAQTAALQFIDELEAAIYHLQAFPETGSPRFAHLLDLPGLRSWSLKRFPFLIFYFETAVSIDIWRILHQHRDVPAHLQSDE